MANRLTLIYPYYNAPLMLQAQLFNWLVVPDKWKRLLTVILIDDCSLEKPALPVVEAVGKLGFDFRLYRVKDDIPWNQHGARNLGVKEAPDGCWLFLSDIDHTLPAHVIVSLMERMLDKNAFYTMKRLTAVRNGPETVEYELMLDSQDRPKPHPNTFLVTKNVFWKAGGYDEDYCGCYGGDGPFRKWLDRSARHVHLDDAHVVRWSRDLIPDASLQPEMRAKYKPLYKPRFDAKGGGRASKPMNWIRFQWERLI